MLPSVADGRRVRQLLSSLVTAVVLLLAVPAAAQQGPAPDDDGGRAQSFRAVEGAVEEDVPGGPLLLMAYGLFWVLMVLYVGHLARQQQRAVRAIEQLEAALRDRPGDGT